jgi:O-antigen/teichoic acid export membrane protein
VVVIGGAHRLYNTHGRRALALADQACSSGTTFLSGVIVARAGSLGEFGLYSLVLFALAWGYSMQGALVTTPYTFGRRELAARQQREYAGTVIWSQLAFAACVTVALAIASGSLRLGASPHTRALAPVLLTAGLAAGICMLRECCRQIAYAHELLKSVLIMDASVATLQLGGLGWLAHGHALTAAHAFLVLGAAATAPTAVWLRTHQGLFDFRHRTLSGHAASSWHFGKWIVAGVLLHSLAKDTFPWIVSAIHGTRAAGTLAAAFGIAFLVNPILVATTNVLGPLFARRLAEGGAAELRRVVWRCTQVAAVGSLVYAATLMLGGAWATTMVYGAQYAESGRAAVWLAVGIAASVVTLPIGVGLYAMHRTDITFHAVGVAAIVAVLAGGPLVYRYAALGVAVVLLLENVAESLAKAIWYHRLWGAPAAAQPGPILAVSATTHTMSDLST